MSVAWSNRAEHDGHGPAHVRPLLLARRAPVWWLALRACGMLAMVAALLAIVVLVTAILIVIVPLI